MNILKRLFGFKTPEPSGWVNPSEWIDVGDMTDDEIKQMAIENGWQDVQLVTTSLEGNYLRIKYGERIRL